MTVREYSADVLKAAEKQGHQEIDQFCSEMAMASADEAPHDTGHLAESITHETTGLEGRVFTETGKASGRNANPSSEGYGYWVHQGTSRMSPNPFFKRGFDKTKAASRG